MSKQIRLGNLDAELDEFLENNSDFPIRSKREIVKFATREMMKNFVAEEKEVEKMEELIDKRIEKEFS